ncbi:MAG TPA: nucleoside deaminase [Gammaproteobacteria bacterium]|nr:tRNA-specific adenosine deaminase [Chromatiales bacterium]MCP4925308.1 nucleoside deaminase [Gammaproteobacteria bacterium]MDP7153185.1 nucleoside deaminase [Gammaproteobacteria bacterium]MDP7661199.1 nucleoside deaminase [Gammaproteobacteria bacterium]HJP37735.1 nucleoside deaminase [Gammaproteobacteria bacterium]
MKPVHPDASTVAPMIDVDTTGIASDASPHDVFMRAALEAARRGMLAGEPPVGACLVADGEIVVTRSNAVIGELDITAHAEMRVIREACRQLRKLDLSGSTLYVTVEPCLMCLTACHYAGIGKVVYGAGIADMNAVTGNELAAAPANDLPLKLEGGCLAAECRGLIVTWSGSRQAGSVS